MTTEVDPEQRSRLVPVTQTEEIEMLESSDEEVQEFLTKTKKVTNLHSPRSNRSTQEQIIRSDSK